MTVIISHIDKKDYDLQCIVSAPWNAKQAYQLYFGDEAKNRYLICYEEYIVEIDLEWEPTKEQMTIITEKLVK